MSSSLRLLSWFLLCRISFAFHRTLIHQWPRKLPSTVWNSPNHEDKSQQQHTSSQHLPDLIKWTTTNVNGGKTLAILLSLIMIISPNTPSLAADDATVVVPSSSSSSLTEPTVASSPEEKFDEAAAGEFVAAVSKSRPLFSDEFVLTFQGESLGLGLTETYYKGFPVVTVNSIKDPVLLQQEGSMLRAGALVIGVGDEETNGIPLKEITAKIQGAGRPVTIKFRDPSRYFELLDSTIGAPKRVITTSYLPANTRDVGAPEQIIKIERLKLPPPEQRVRSAQLLDVMEIQYVAQLPNYTDR